MKICQTAAGCRTLVTFKGAGLESTRFEGHHFSALDACSLGSIPNYSNNRYVT
jgi:hypothetical protein